MTNRNVGADVLLTAAAALATKRLTTLVVEDEIARDIRDRVWDSYPPETTKLGYLISCRKCTSIWAGAAVLLLGSSKWTRWIVGALTLSEASLQLDVAFNSQNVKVRPDNDSTGGFFD